MQLFESEKKALLEPYWEFKDGTVTSII